MRHAAGEHAAHLVHSIAISVSDRSNALAILYSVERRGIEGELSMRLNEGCGIPLF